VSGGHKATQGGDAWREAASQEAGESAVTAREAAPREAAAHAPPVITVMLGAHEAAWREAAAQLAAAQEDGEPAAAVIAPPVITVVPGGHKAAWREAAAQVEAAREDGEPAVIAPPLLTVIPGARDAVAQEAAAQEAAIQVAVAHDNTENTPPPTKCARVSPAQQDAEGVIFVDNHSGVSHELTESPLGHDVSANLFLNTLLNVNNDTRKFMIIKLVSHSDIRRSITNHFPSNLQQECGQLGRMYTSVRKACSWEKEKSTLRW